MGNATINLKLANGADYAVNYHYEEGPEEDGAIVEDDRQEASVELEKVIRETAEDLRHMGARLPEDARITITENRPDTCHLFCWIGYEARLGHDTVIPSTGWKSSVMRLLDPRVPAEAGSPTELRERFSQYAMQAGSVIGWDGEGLYERIVNSQQPVLGAIRQEQIDRWKGGEDFPIALPQLTDQEIEGIKQILARNTRTRGNDQTQLAQEFQEIHDKIRKATDQTQNLQDPMHPGETGADGDPTTLSAVEVKDLGDFLVDEDDWDKKTIKEDVLKMVAAYLSIVNFYREMNASGQG